MSFRFKSIKTKLTFWLILIAVIPLVAVTAITYNQRSGATRIREFNKLTAIRDLKVQQLNKWLDERIGDIKTISEDIDIRNLESIFCKRVDHYSMDAFKEIKENFKRYKKNYPYYRDVSLLNPNTGVIEVSTDDSFEGENRAGSTYFREPLQTRDRYISDIYYSERLDMPSMVISVPVFCAAHHGRHVVGIVLGRIDVERSQRDFLLDRTGLGNTGETFIVNKEGFALTELRWHENAQLRVRMDGEPVRQAVSGRHGIMEETDYRGEKTLVAYTYIPATKWGFIAKQDIDEVYEPIYRMLRDFSVLLIIAVVIVYFIANQLAKNLSKPLIEMTNTSKRIQEGDLSARNRITDENELGYLAGTINNLADFMVSRIDIQHGSAEIIEMIATVDELSDFRKKLLLKLMDISGADLGAYYRLNKDDNRFHLFTSVGINAELFDPFDNSTAEGTFSSAIVNKRIIHMGQIPEGSRFVYKTFAGGIEPREIITVPLVIEGEVRGIISLGKISPFSGQTLEILNQTWQSINNALSNLLAHIETKRLADELFITNTELMKKSAELERQASILQEQSAMLQRQNVKLEEQRRQVEEANRLKSEFLSNMSHELRTPLNSIMALSRVLVMQAGKKLTGEEKNYLNIIDRNGKSLLNLINDILDLSRIEAGRVDVNIRVFSVVSLIRSITENLEPVAEEKGITLGFDSDILPDIESDENMVRQILQNIIANAVKFTEEGGVNISADLEDERIAVRVEDTGIGISERDLPHIFDEFWQVDGSNARRYNGTGLGLAISYKTAQIIRGEISVESEPGKGSVFIVRIPVKWEKRGGEETRGKTYPAHPSKSEPKKILVVDDNPEVVKLISGYLEQEGFKPVGAMSGADALKLAKSEKPFAITLDILMPEMDGWEVLQSLKNDSETSNIPVVIISVSENAETGFALGAVGYISKPVRKERLLEEIKNVTFLDKRTVLVVDDNELDLKEMSRIIEDNHMDALGARNGRECLNTLENIIPDVLVLDLMMPEINGFEVLKKIRNNPSTARLPIIIVTAKDLTNADKKRLSGNVSSVIQKVDLTFNTLLSEIKRILYTIGEDNGEKAFYIDDKTGENPAGGKSGKQDKKPAILIIEDNPDNMTTAKAILGNRYAIYEATDGETGLKMVFNEKPDLVLLDVALPNISGVDVLKRIRTSSESSDIPVIAMTAYAMKGDREKLLDEGCDGYLSKPINPDELLSMVEEFLSGKE